MDYTTLFSPLNVGPCTMKNRIKTGPMSIVELDAKGAYTEQALAFYESLAAGGAAVVTLGESIIASDNGMTHLQQIRFDNPNVPFSLQRAADAVHAHNALINIEISHGGAMADSAYNNGVQSMGPSAFTDEWGDNIREMSEDDMEKVAESFADAAEICADCSFDMVMIHCGHGWLLHQFLSPHFNRRTDKYGGSIENRARFPLMVIDHVRKRVGKRIAIDMRISGSEFLDDGLEIEDVTAFCKMCEDRVDIINVSAGMPWGKRMAISVFDERGINSEFSAAVKKVVTKIPVSSVGGYTEPSLMEKYLKEGRCDSFVLGRSILADPELPQKARTGRDKEIHKCLRCYVCNNAQYIARGKVLRCAINPYAGREFTMRTVPASTKRKIVVVGGGPGGMAAAVQAAKRGHKVSLYEKTDALGGWLLMEKHLSFKEDMYNYAKTLEYECSLYGVDIHLNATIDKTFLEKQKPDLVICAIGSKPFVPPIPGKELSNVFIAVDAYSYLESVEKEIVIIGGGLVGCEIGYDLSLKGRRVTILEMRENVAIDATNDHRRFLMERLEPTTSIHCNVNVTEITPDGVHAKDADGKDVFYKADSILMATGMMPLSEEAEALRSPEYDFAIIGDARRPRNVYAAVREGFDAATFTR
ncbi:MAG: FAD-dependent oxidoreductase [Eubacterium sp.]|nr:FAD-dependent oxidoreductase [Eubacterium sp.]